MSQILYCYTKNLPAYVELEEKAQLLKQAYDIGVDALKKQLDIAQTEFKNKLLKAREEAEFIYSVAVSTREKGTYYTINRKVINPLIGDDEFNKEITYIPFKIVNNVIIMDGGGYYFQHVFNGDIISDEDINLLNTSVVPDIFRNKPKIENKIYHVGT